MLYIWPTLNTTQPFIIYYDSLQEFSKKILKKVHFYVLVTTILMQLLLCHLNLT